MARKFLFNDVFVGALVCVPAAAIYGMGLQRSVWTGDSAEFVTAAYTLGIPHPTGYPIYVWLGKLFTFLPLGGVALRVNLMSLVFALAALYFAFLIVATELRRLRGSSFFAWMGGVSAMALLGFARPFWERAEAAEVYTMSAFFMVFFAYLYLRWLETTDLRLLCGASLVYGLGLGTHLSNILLLPVLVFILAIGVQRRVRILRTLLFVIIGLSQYLYLLVRSAVTVPYVHPDARFFQHNSLTGTANPVYNWLWYITGGQWHGESVRSLAEAAAKIGRLLDAVLSNFTAVGVFLLVCGVVAYCSFSRPRSKAAVILGIAVCGIVYFATYGFSNEAMILPFFAAVSILCGVGLGFVGIRLAKGSKPVGRLVAHIVTIALAAFVVYKCLTRPPVDFSQRNGPSVLVAGMIDALPEGSTVDGLKWKYGKIVEYYEIVGGARIPFRDARCDLNRIGEDSCFVLDVVSDRYERMGFKLEPYLHVDGAPELYLVRPPDK